MSEKLVVRLTVNLVLAVTVLAVAIPAFALSARVAYAAPAAATSRYMSTTDGNTLYNEGCAQTNEGGAIILNFGQPWFDGSNYGTNVFGSVTFRSVYDIEAAVKQWLSGYYLCGGSGFVRLGIGTSNYHGYTDYGHGQAWAQMVNRVETWIESPPSWADREAARGASDIELDWNSVGNSRAWIQGFSDVGCCLYYDYGDAAGCPPYGACNNGWTQEDVWYKSWGARPAYAIPEIYSNSLAQEWYRISLYGYTNHGAAAQILGTMTQWAASGYCCTNAPDQGWQQMYDALNGDSRTSQGIPYSTDITWAN